MDLRKESLKKMTLNLRFEDEKVPLNMPSPTSTPCSPGDVLGSRTICIPVEKKHPEKQFGIFRKIWRLQDNKFVQILNYIIILGLICTVFYLFMLASFYKSLNRSIPDISFCQDSDSSSDNSEWDKIGKEITTEAMRKIHLDTWKYYKKTSEGFTCFTNDDGMYLWKINGTVNYTTTDQAFHEFDKWIDWDRGVKNSTILKEFSNKNKVGYYIEAFMGIKRDIIALCHWERSNNDKDIIMGLNSLIWAQEDEEKRDTSLVRAFLNNTGMFISQKDDGTVFFEFIVHVDLKIDWLPFKDTIMLRYVENKANAFFRYIRKINKEKERYESLNTI